MSEPRVYKFEGRSPLARMHSPRLLTAVLDAKPVSREGIMRTRLLSTLVAVVMIGAPVLGVGQSLPYPTDPQTGRAVGANEIAAQGLLVDVRPAE